ncbi:MAG: hypothetical protein MJD61_15215 [Proteobacteria bacterium]|nr:hypothetical protein [Pseudomonadota bacterium]
MSSLAADDPVRARALLDRLRERSEWLRAQAPARAAAAIAAAARDLLDESSPHGIRLRRELQQTTGLSLPLIEWGLSSTLGGATARRLSTLAAVAKTRSTLAVPARVVLLVLAGNVFSAAFRELALSLLLGCPVLAKASREDDVLPRLFCDALRQRDPEVGSACEVLTLPAGSEAMDRVLLQRAEVVAVFGSDETVAAVRCAIPATVRLVVHGHGFGAIYVPKAALCKPARVREVVRRVALDVAAYDQRGCLSPHAIAVQRGGSLDGSSFARLLASALARLERRLPRGRPPADVQATQMQWRGVGAARGTVFETPDFAVSYEGSEALRQSPGYRNVGVYACTNAEALGAWLAPAGAHLKCLGIAADRSQRERVAAELPATLAPRVCGVGCMQSPPLSRLSDGEPAWRGLLRFIELG